ncbi:MAG: hypothetical protein D6732_21645 [Methanobacteriota archaeon]|nr:MAG: hypothetical protein D6732_21645 [Euryarchaeota archaeon]
MYIEAFELNSTTFNPVNSTDDLNVAKLIIYSTIDLNGMIYAQTLLAANAEKTPIGYYFGFIALLVLSLGRKRR